MSFPLFNGVLDSCLSGMHARSFSMVGLLFTETTKHAPDPKRQLTVCPVSASIFYVLIPRSWYGPAGRGGEWLSKVQANGNSFCFMRAYALSPTATIWPMPAQGHKRHWPVADHQTACATCASKFNTGRHEKCCVATPFDAKAACLIPSGSSHSKRRTSRA